MYIEIKWEAKSSLTSKGNVEKDKGIGRFPIVVSHAGRRLDNPALGDKR